jgi:DNA repair photolyase
MDNKNFFNDIFVKKNIVQVLLQELNKKNWNNNNVLCISGVCDCYQPCEEKYKLMQDILKILIKNKQSIYILTKSNLILRDYDLIAELSNVAKYVNIAMSIPTLNKDISSKIEPNVISGIERLKTLIEFTKIKNCRTTYMLLPIIPYLTDKKLELENIFENISRYKIQNIIYGALNMRGEVKTNFYSFLKKEFPDVLEKIQKLYKGSYVSKNYSINLDKFCRYLTNKYNIKNNTLYEDDHDANKQMEFKF